MSLQELKYEQFPNKRMFKIFVTFRHSLLKQRSNFATAPLAECATRRGESTHRSLLSAGINDVD
jgi:hypothetical protein